ncbi:hypothetical protein BDY21DRAFT_22447 [Lineolata rhizophorae]|uniref:Transmembrane protein 135 N-terminal domain-containing protein n=1 Tax=Lineolata rhizophorae TaxID=578093 RepID=A0A6A6P274_9PEZI|nr:hypothetical protein BDY21DRAFT_22447 [Lineolata rhizophorae]
MASSSSSVSSSSSSGSGRESVDPVLRNALRYTVSAKEYKLLHRYLISRAPAVRRRTLQPRRYETVVTGSSADDYNAATVRAALRVFGSIYGGLKLWDLFTQKVLNRGKPRLPSPKIPFWKSPNFRLSSSFALILLFHRLLHRFFIRLRESLLTENARPFRQRNPRVARTLTSRLAPAIGASLSGFFLAVSPKDQLRVTIAIYLFTRALEFSYNRLENKGYFKDRPLWFGSWLLMPAVFGQLLHAFTFDRDCFPEEYGRFILNNSPQYVQKRPANYPAHLPWPGPYDIADSLAEISRLRWPKFTSPILFPDTQTLPSSLSAIAPITSSAHPATTNLSCAVLHPHDPSCLRTYITYWLRAFPRVARFFTLAFTAFALVAKPFRQQLVASPISTLNALAARILRASAFVTGAIGTSWGAICLLQSGAVAPLLLPHGALPRQRWFLHGALGGCWAILARSGGRDNFLYSARVSIDSAWKVGVKHGWWKGIKGGDVLLFTASLALVDAVYEVDPKAVSGGMLRKGLGVLRGEGWVDRAASAKGEGEEGKVVEERESEASGLEGVDRIEEEAEKAEEKTE